MNHTTNLQPFVRRAGAGEVWRVLGETIYHKVQGAETGGAFSVVEEISAPGGGAPPHFHRATDETIYVLDGEFEMVCDGRTIKAQTGDMVFIPRGMVHSFRNTRSADSRLLAVITPSGFEQFFAGVDALPPAAEPDLAQIAALGERHDLFLTIG